MANNEDQNKEQAQHDKQERLASIRSGDLTDNEHDQERMESEEVIMDLPEVKDIPGQEFVHPPVLDAFSDTTIASDDEEGAGIFGDEYDPDPDGTAIRMGTEADVSKEEQTALERADIDMPTQDDIMLRKAALDETDNEGEDLNEGSLANSVSGADLDMNVSKGGNESSAMGQGDEENSHYSLGSDSNDNVTEGTP